MVNFYTQKYLDGLKNKKKLHLLVIITIMSIMLITNVIMIINFAGYPYGSGKRVPFTVISCIITVVLTFFSGVYYEIMYVPVKNHYAKVVEVLTGKKDKSNVSILRFNNDELDKLGVKFRSFDALTWSDIQNDYVERTIIYDCDFSVNFNENQMVDVVTCGNVLLSYEVKEWKEIK